MKKVVKVNISGYYLVDENIPEDVLGTATVEEFIKDQIDFTNKQDYDQEELLELVEIMLHDMKTKPTVRLELKKD